MSVVTFIDMFALMWHSTVISSSESEAAYVIDGLIHKEAFRAPMILDTSAGAKPRRRTSKLFLTFFALSEGEEPILAGIKPAR